MQKKNFSPVLLKWHQSSNDRQMPWKGEKDPYRVWLSEIILQQTRVEQGLQYYNRFVSTYPTIKALAQAPDEKVFKLWEGLGYYSRCRNLLHTARFVSGELDGKFPSEYEKIKQLKGIGPYTAAAIAAFSFNLPYAVTDGNVYRVLSRIFGINTPFDNTEGKKIFSALAADLLDKNQPGLYNQAIMDFGATVCKPQLPLCKECVFKKNCFAFKNSQVDQLPVRSKKQLIRNRWFYYLVIDQKKSGTFSIAIRKRTSKDIWKDLYEFPLVESTEPKKVNDILGEAERDFSLLKNHYTLTSVSPVFKQQLSHQLIAGQFIRIKLNPGSKKIFGPGLVWVTKEQLVQFPFPRYINKFLEQHNPWTPA